MAKVRQKDVLRYGQQIAALKASMPRKRWRRIVEYAHSKGHTVAGQLSGAPDALKERTNKSLRDEARRTIASAYKPVESELDRRTLANQFLEKKRTDDDAAFRTWLMGEVDKLDAQARAADTTLQSQEKQIADDLGTAQKVAQADSLARVSQQAGNISSPQQSTALDYSAADDKSRGMVANSRQLSADLQKIGNDARGTSRAAAIATLAVREATHRSELDKDRNDIDTARSKAAEQRAADTKSLLSDLRGKEAEKAQANREFDLAAGELGFKKQSLAAEVKEANRKYQLDREKFNLDKWIAQNRKLAEDAKIELGYDQIASREGQKAADRALRRWIEKHKSRTRREDKKAGISSDERDLFSKIETIRGLIVREHGRGTNPAKIRQRMRRQGFADTYITLAEYLRRSNGVVTGPIRTLAKQIGIEHPGYFWEQSAGPPTPN